MRLISCISVQDIVEALITNEKLTNPYGLSLGLCFYSLIHRSDFLLFKQPILLQLVLVQLNTLHI